MTYVYECEKCKKTIEIEKSIKEEIPKNVPCDKCKNTCFRVWKSSIIIPDYMKAQGDANKDYGGNIDYVKRRMKKRPSGKDKIYW